MGVARGGERGLQMVHRFHDVGESLEAAGMCLPSNPDKPSTPSPWFIAERAPIQMRFALLEPDLDELDRVLEILASLGHVCFGTSNDTAFRRLLTEVSVDACLIDWVDPDSCRYETLCRLQSELAVPVVLCVVPGTRHDVIDSGLKLGASFSIEKPFRAGEWLDLIPAWEMNGFVRSSVSGNRIRLSP